MIYKVFAVSIALLQSVSLYAFVGMSGAGDFGPPHNQLVDEGLMFLEVRDEETGKLLRDIGYGIGIVFKTDNEAEIQVVDLPNGEGAYTTKALVKARYQLAGDQLSIETNPSTYNENNLSFGSMFKNTLILTGHVRDEGRIFVDLVVEDGQIFQSGKVIGTYSLD